MESSLAEKYDFIKRIHSGELDILTWLREQDEDTIRARVYERIPEDINLSVGSYAYDAIEPGNIEFAVAYFALRNIIMLAFPQYSFGEGLTLSAAAKGVSRTGATYAHGDILITGKTGTFIPTGAKFTNTVTEGSAEAVKYYTTQGTVIIPSNGKAYVEVKSDESGAAGNAAAGEINLNVQSIPNIIAVINEEPLANGFDEESDESLLARLLEHVRNPSSSGNKTDYKKWAKEVPGVVDADVIPLHYGPGTVKVIIVGEGGEPIPGLINEVKEYLDPSDHEGEGEGKAPVGAVVTVVTVENFYVDIEISGLEVKSNFTPQTVQSNIITALTSAVASVGIGGLIRKRHIEDAALHANGAEDFSSMLMNGENKNVQVDPHLKARLGEVRFLE